MAASHLHAHCPLKRQRCSWPRHCCMQAALPGHKHRLHLQHHSAQHLQLSSRAHLAQALLETKIEFLNHRGEKLVGTLSDPESITHMPPPPPPSAAGAPQNAPQQQLLPPVVILAHGYMSSRNSELLVRLATAFGRSCKLSSFRFDFSGNGDSEGEFRYGQYRSEARELRCAQLHLQQRLGRRVVCMLGHSKGATDVLLYAAQYGDVPCVVNLAARFELQQGVLQRLGPAVLQQLEESGQVQLSGRSHKGSFTWHLRKEDLQDRLDTDMAAACGSIAETAVLTVHGSADADVPVQDAHKIAAAIKAPHEW
ncbi:Alpha/Beta hydrolase protein [Scenedesmus sp. NREL 46B-D3]|nr:Alpha/Beta hydrolase protein [Scenedesmus sp. NREL 46B-D3]